MNGLSSIPSSVSSSDNALIRNTCSTAPRLGAVYATFSESRNDRVIHGDIEIMKKRSFANGELKEGEIEQVIIVIPPGDRGRRGVDADGEFVVQGEDEINETPGPSAKIS